MSKNSENTDFKQRQSDIQIAALTAEVQTTNKFVSGLLVEQQKQITAHEKWLTNTHNDVGNLKQAEKRRWLREGTLWAAFVGLLVAFSSDATASVGKLFHKFFN